MPPKSANGAARGLAAPRLLPHCRDHEQEAVNTNPRAAQRKFLASIVLAVLAVCVIWALGH